MAKKNGTDWLIYVDGTVVGCATDSTLTVNRETIDTSCKDSEGWADNLSGQKSWELTSENVLDLAASYGYEEAFDELVGTNDVTVKMDTTFSGEPYLEGSARITSLELNAPNEDVTTMSVTFEGNGEITKTVNT